VFEWQSVFREFGLGKGLGEVMELERFLVPLDGGNPSGAELRNDARFHTIDRLIEPAARSYRLDNVKGGGTGSVAVDWGQALDLAADLAGTGRDLRLLGLVVRSLANAEGFAGFAEGLALLKATFETHWATVHPELRPSPSKSEAAIRRINALKQLENTDNGLLGDLEFNTVLSVRGIGLVTGGDLAASTLNRGAFLAESPSGLGEKEQTALAEAHDARAARAVTTCRAYATEHPEAMAELQASVAGSRAALAAMEAALNVHVSENGVGVRFKDLDKFLMRVATALGAAQPQAAASHQTGGGDAAMAPEPTAYSNGAAGPAALPGKVNSRADVEKLLDLIIDYYDRTEPSSPIPHMAKRMRKMVPMNFVQLMEELAPSGMKEFKTVAGVVDDRK